MLQKEAEFPAIVALITATLRAIGRAVFASAGKVASQGVGSVIANKSNVILCR